MTRSAGVGEVFAGDGRVRLASGFHGVDLAVTRDALGSIRIAALGGLAVDAVSELLELGFVTL